MRIDKITIEGFANIDKVSLSLTGMNALIALNNYGKSNVLLGVDFGFEFITATQKEKLSQMNYRPAISINTTLSGRPFRFEIEGIIPGKCSFIYGYAFEWAKTLKEDKGTRITEEFLKLKGEDESKFRSYICRNASESALYLASPTGRCSKNLSLERTQLALNKLDNFDDLFYIDIIKELNSVDIMAVDTLINPDTFFCTISSDCGVNEYCLKVPKPTQIGFFVYSMKQKEPEKYQLFKDAVISLLPNIEDFESVEIDMKNQFKPQEKNEKIPFNFPEKFFDIRVKETYNNQDISISAISSGSKKIFFVLAMAIAADINKIPILTFEELENSVHPSLLQNLLIALNNLSGDAKILITSHSPNLLKYLELNRIMVGLPNSKGIAMFRGIKTSKMKKIKKLASDEDASIGDFLFDLMQDVSEENLDLLNEYFE